MPTEAQLTTRVLAAVRQRWPGSWRWKINERTRAGVPDAYLLNDGIGVFVEFKKLKWGQSTNKVVSPIQRATLLEIHKANEGRAVVVGIYPDGSQVVVNAYGVPLALHPGCHTGDDFTTLQDYLVMVWG